MRLFEMQAVSALFLLVCIKNDRPRVWSRARILVLAADCHSTTRRAHAKAVR
jgi:hypothetical protein